MRNKGEGPGSRKYGLWDCGGGTGKRGLVPGNWGEGTEINTGGVRTGVRIQD